MDATPKKKAQKNAARGGTTCGRTTRGRMSRIQQLPEVIKKKLDAMLVSGVSQREILRRLATPLADAGEQPLSAAGLNRYASKMEKLGQRIRQSREVAEVWTAKFGDKPTGELSQHIINMLRTLAFEFTLTADGINDEYGNPIINPASINELALAIQRLERAATLSTQREKELRRGFAEEAEQAVKKAGASEATVAMIRSALTGKEYE